MSNSLRLSLKAGERLYINGAVLKVDRKVTIELLNEAHFLLSHHIITAQETKTPLRQLYFIIQSMLMQPETAGLAKVICHDSVVALARAFENHDVLGGLVHVFRCVDEDRPYEALRTLRKLLPIEAEILGSSMPRLPVPGVNSKRAEETVPCN
jgi:flagellar biosynthesis repressor protein FlbT